MDIRVQCPTFTPNRRLSNIIQGEYVELRVFASEEQSWYVIY